MRPALAACAALGALLHATATLAADSNDVGRQLFTTGATPPCAVCHTLAEAGATGNVGPSLDELKPQAARVAQAVRTGFGAMPPYPQLTDDQVKALAQYVARASGAER